MISDPKIKEALNLASLLRGMTECGVAPDDLWERDQPDGDPFVARAAEMLDDYAKLLKDLEVIIRSVAALRPLK